MKSEKLIVPVIGHGKGRYRFNIQITSEDESKIVDANRIRKGWYVLWGYHLTFYFYRYLVSFLL